MKFIYALFVLSIFVVSTFAAEDDVLVLTKENFDSTLKAEELVLVEFYAPWCGHCKKLIPEYAAAAGTLKSSGSPIKLAKVDATIETELASRYSVTGYPTLKVFRYGSPSEYKGPRDAAGIVTYMEKQSGPSAKPITSEQELRKFLDNADVSIIGFFPEDSNPNKKGFISTAEHLREEFRFALVKDAEIAKAVGISVGVSLFYPRDPKPQFFDGIFSSFNLQHWIWPTSIPVVGDYTRTTQERYKRYAVPVLKVFMDVDYASNLKQTNYYINRIKKVASDSKYDHKLVFAVVNKKDFNDQLQKFNIPPNRPVGIAIEDETKSLKYIGPEEFSVDSIRKFADDFIEGKLTSYIKSEPVPEKNDNPVTVVVGTTFNDIVLDDSKYVLIELYAPWCGHCKKLEPIYTELAEKVKKELPNVVIAKMDATANDSPHAAYQAKGYPTILLAPAGNKGEAIPYKGTREVQPMFDWLKSQSTSK